MSWRSRSLSPAPRSSPGPAGPMKFDPRADALELMLRDDTYSDAIIRCTAGGKTLRDFQVNAMFMASASDLWKEAFFPEDKKDSTEASDETVATEGEPIVFIMKDVPPTEMECIVRYAYFLDPRITVSNALPIRLLCEKYKITGLKSVCDDLLSEKSMTPYNVCEMLASAVRYELDSLAKSCVKSVEENFKRSEVEIIFNSEGFNKLPISVLEYLLKSDRLKIKEEQLWEYLIIWAATQAAMAERAAILGGGDDPSTVAKSVEYGLDDEPAVVEEAKSAPSATLAPSSTGEATEPSPATSPKKEDGAPDEEKKEDAPEAPPKEKLRTQQDFLRAVKTMVRFPVMDQKFLLTTVSSMRVLSLEEEHAILKTQFLGEKHCDFIMEKRKGGASFEEAIKFQRGTHGGSWSYSGPIDALCVTLSAPAILVAVGLWCADGGTTATVNIYRGPNGSGQTPVARFPEQSFPTVGRNTEPHPFIFPEPFEMEASTLYTIELTQRNTTGSSSYHTSSGRTTTITHEGITVTLSNAAHSPNSTTGTGSGALPCFWFVPG